METRLSSRGGARRSAPPLSLLFYRLCEPVGVECEIVEGVSKDADGIILATTVEWFGIGGYMLTRTPESEMVDPFEEINKSLAAVRRKALVF